MDSTNLILTEPALLSRPFELDARYQILDTCRGSRVENREQIAKDFESVLLNKILDEMKETIGDWGFEKDEACKQVQGIFWLYLARDIADKGGFGLWKDIYEFLTNAERANTTAESLNKNI